MRSFIKTVCCFAALSACVAEPLTPLTDYEMEREIYWRQVAEHCIKKGRVSSPAAAQDYIQSIDAYVADRSEPARANAVRQKMANKFPYSSTSPEVCRMMDAQALQAVQQKSIQRRAAIPE